MLAKVLQQTDDLSHGTVRNPKHVWIAPPGCIVCEVTSILKGDCDESRLHIQNGKELREDPEAKLQKVMTIGSKIQEICVNYGPIHINNSRYRYPLSI